MNSEYIYCSSQMSHMLSMNLRINVMVVLVMVAGDESDSCGSFVS